MILRDWSRLQIPPLDNISPQTPTCWTLATLHHRVTKPLRVRSRSIHFSTMKTTCPTVPSGGLYPWEASQMYPCGMQQQIQQDIRRLLYRAQANRRVGTLTMISQSSSRRVHSMDLHLFPDHHQDRTNRKWRSGERSGSGHGTRRRCSRVSGSLGWMTSRDSKMAISVRIMSVRASTTLQALSQSFSSVSKSVQHYRHQLILLQSNSANMRTCSSSSLHVFNKSLVSRQLIPTLLSHHLLLCYWHPLSRRRKRTLSDISLTVNLTLALPKFYVVTAFLKLGNGRTFVSETSYGLNPMTSFRQTLSSYPAQNLRGCATSRRVTSTERRTWRLSKRTRLPLT